MDKPVSITPEEVKAIRQRLKLTQVGLAKALGVNRKTIIAWEAGYNTPHAVFVDKLRGLR